MVAQTEGKGNSPYNRTFWWLVLVGVSVVIIVAFLVSTFLNDGIPSKSATQHQDRLGWAIDTVKLTPILSFKSWPLTAIAEREPGATVESSIMARMKKIEGPLKILGWHADEMKGCYLVSFTFDKGFGAEGYYYEVNYGGLVRYVNWDEQLAEYYGLEQSADTSYTSIFIRPGQMSGRAYLLWKRSESTGNDLRLSAFAELAFRMPVRRVLDSAKVGINR